MKTKNAPRRARLAALAGLSLSAIAIACSSITVAPPATPVRVSALDILRHGFDNAAVAAIGARLQSMYGNRHNADEVFVYVAVQGPIGKPAVVLPFTKPCNERFDQQGREDEDEDEDGDDTPPSSGGGSGGGGIGFPSFPYIPGGCVGNCGGTVEVGDIEQT